MRNSIHKKGLIFGLIISLSLPTIAFGREPAANPNSTNQPINLVKSTNAVSITSTLNLLNLPAIYPKEQSELTRKDQIFESNKQQDRFVQNAVQFLTNMEEGNGRQALKLSSRALKKSISEQWIETYWTTLMQQLQPQGGSFIGFGTAKVKESNRVHTNVEVELQFEKATFPFILRLDQSGKVDDFQLNMFTGPFALDPEYSDPDSFIEKDVVVGKGDFALHGTLSIPKGKGPFPVVVLVQGSGASDQDEAAYALKPFRDLAYGLATKGIAVLRYNKRTFEHTVNQRQI